MSYWENKKVLITGGHGFVGNNLVELFKKKQETENIELLVPNRKDCDLTKEIQVENYFNTHKPDVVLHLAGKVGGIGANKAAPGDFFYQNIMMGTLVLEHGHRTGC